METVGCALWRNENTLEVNIRAIASTVARRFIFTFHGKRISLQPRTVPDMETRTEQTAEKLKTILKGRYFAWWIKVLTPRVTRILQPTQYGYAQRKNGIEETLSIT
ncbi:MAG: hypothetical protein ACI4SB_09235, partial [Acutalibacteraceae bacterium]